jgi:hypothetical protein
MDSKKIIIGILLILLIMQQSKKKCTCTKTEGIGESEEDKPKSVLGSILPSKKIITSPYSKEEICDCKKAVSEVLKIMKFKSEEEAQEFQEKEIEKCLKTK